MTNMAKRAQSAEAKAAVKKNAPRAVKVKTTIALQFHGRELNETDLVEKAKQLWEEAGKSEAIKELNLYVKPEDNAVYCVANGETIGSFEI